MTIFVSVMEAPSGHAYVPAENIMIMMIKKKTATFCQQLWHIHWFCSIISILNWSFSLIETEYVQSVMTVLISVIKLDGLNDPISECVKLDDDICFCCGAIVSIFTYSEPFGSLSHLFWEHFHHTHTHIYIYIYICIYVSFPPSNWINSWTQAKCASCLMISMILIHYRDVTWALWRLKQQTTPLFVQSFVQAYIKGNIKAPLYGWPVALKGPGTRKMTSSCVRPFLLRVWKSLTSYFVQNCL